MKLYAFIALICLQFLAQPLPAAQSHSEQMTFEECLAHRERVIISLNVNPQNIIPVVNTGIVTITRICTADGSVLITCSKPDQKMVLTMSDRAACR